MCTIPYISEEEYLGIERNSEIKHEYFDGEIFAMSRKHNLIVADVVGELPITVEKETRIVLI